MTTHIAAVSRAALVAIAIGISVKLKPNGQSGVYGDSSTDATLIKPTVAAAVTNCGKLINQQGDASYQVGRSCIGGNAPPDGPTLVVTDRARSREIGAVMIGHTLVPAAALPR
ncbi:hypothetical protein J2785_007077 [Burkholderia ambifaria]|nr:hypothetical protein [Burkholderia ambifaria]MDR6503884.1 hypothetical protein [Burkholderia ambifaria]